ncbi:MAG: hypothetical protein LH605_00895 [Microbacteriaceae bacterium]|nr:hypothetical protein [Microbacteriaceae bacterium]
MHTFLISVVGVLGLFFLWGLVSPRTQWHVLVGWTRTDPITTEPGSVAYATSRFVSLLGLLTVFAIGVSWGVGAITFDQDEEVRPPTVAERVWGAPRPYVVDRVFTPLPAPPEGLVEQQITGYQKVIGYEQSPSYLFAAGKIRAAGLATQPGFIGVEPLPGTVALDTADLLVHVRGDNRCIPQQVVAVPVDGGVQIGVFFGQLNPADGSNAENVGDCAPSPAASDTRGFLIPVDLVEPLGNRVVQSLAGEPITRVPLPVR